MRAALAIRAAVRARAAHADRARHGRPTTRPAFVVEDGNYVSARWPGDAYLFARRFAALLDKAESRET